MLNLDKMGGTVARVFVNGKERGAAKVAPMQLDITKLARPGENDLRIEITNSLRNLLGPHHHIAGEQSWCGRILPRGRRLRRRV